MKGLMPVIIFTIIFGLILYYFFLPAINIKSIKFWIYLFIVLTVFISSYSIKNYKNVKDNGVIKISSYVMLGMIIFFVISLIFSSKIFNAKKYAKILEPNIVEEDVSTYKATLNNVPLLDRTSAELIGNRKLGSLIDVVSQFELGISYQITYKGNPVRVAPLEYGGFFKWINNKNNGTPGYILIDMKTQEAKLVRVEGGIRYTTSEYFGRDLMRHIRKNYPQAIVDNFSFELNEEDKPFWIVSVIDYNIGLFGGADVRYVLVVDATTGEIMKYNVGEVPEWVDNVYPTNLILQQYDNYGSLQNGFLNSIFGQKGVKVTTEGYNYIPQGDDNWIYTGVTSTGKDESNIGFILVNKRTKEVIYYPWSGAEEYSAMESAQGVVQHLGYISTFPLLLQVEGKPTYVVALKDDAGLVKMYGMVNVEKYQIVATGETIGEAQKKYRQLLLASGEEVIIAETEIIEGIIETIKVGNKEGTTYYYLKLQNNDSYFSLSLLDNEEAVLLEIGDQVRLNCEISKNRIIPATLGK